MALLEGIEDLGREASLGEAALIGLFGDIIKKWPLFSSILDRRLVVSRPVFQLMTGKEQAALLTLELRSVGSSVSAGLGQGPVPFSRLSSRMRSLLACASFLF